MDKPKTSFVYYKDWAEELMKLPSDLRLRIDDAVKRYVFYGEEPTDREVLYSMFALMRTQIDRDAEKYERIRAVRSDAGNKGNLKRWGDRSQNVANVANATNASQKSQKVANVAVDVDADVDADADVDVDADADKTPFGVIDNVSRSLSLKERQKMFYNELIPYVGKYTSVLLRSFFDYWSEPSQNGSKMRRELEKTWDTEKRLARWERNEKPTPGTHENRTNDSAAQTVSAAAAAVSELLAGNE